jgi:flagellar protein FliL
MAKKKTEDDGKKKDSKKKIIAGVVIAVIGYKFFLAPKPAANAEGAPKKEGSVVSLPELTLNLANGKYLRVGIALVYWEGHGGGGGGHGAAAGPDKEASIASVVLRSS